MGERRKPKSDANNNANMCQWAAGVMYAFLHRTCELYGMVRNTHKHENEAPIESILRLLDGCILEYSEEKEKNPNFHHLLSLAFEVLGISGAAATATCGALAHERRGQWMNEWMKMPEAGFLCNKNLNFCPKNVLTCFMPCREFFWCVCENENDKLSKWRETMRNCTMMPFPHCHCCSPFNSINVLFGGVHIRVCVCWYVKTRVISICYMGLYPITNGIYFSRVGRQWRRQQQRMGSVRGSGSGWLHKLTDRQTHHAHT